MHLKALPDPCLKQFIFLAKVKTSGSTLPGTLSPWTYDRAFCSQRIRVRPIWLPGCPPQISAPWPTVSRSDGHSGSPGIGSTLCQHLRRDAGQLFPCAAITRHWSDVDLMLVQCLCRWPNIKPSSAQGPCFSFHAPAAALSPWQLLPSARSSWWFRGSLPWRLLESADPPPFWGK